MVDETSLVSYLNTWSKAQSDRAEIATTLECIASTSIKLSQIIGHSCFDTDSEGPVSKNSQGEAQKPLGMQAHQLFENAFRNAPVGLLVSQEIEEAILLDKQATLGVAIDPLDGSTNIDTNLSVGTVFSIFPFDSKDRPLTQDLFLNKTGTDQVAAGFIVFGPQTTLTITCRSGTHIFALDSTRNEYFLVRENVQIPVERREFAINASNYHHWDSSIRGYVDDCIAGQAGPRGAEFNMRWAASLVAEAYRIFVRGGIFLYPRDSRPGFSNGRLRLLYEAFPMALLVEQAGGAATDGERRLLDLVVTELHQRVPLVFGSKDKVERVARYYANPPVEANRYPLFESRTLLRN
jgi:fructose-1,6-bisphosphatase I